MQEQHLKASLSSLSPPSSRSPQRSAHQWPSSCAWCKCIGATLVPQAAANIMQMPTCYVWDTPMAVRHPPGQCCAVSMEVIDFWPALNSLCSPTTLFGVNFKKMTCRLIHIQGCSAAHKSGTGPEIWYQEAVS